MLVVQILLPDASQYDQKSQRIDAAALADRFRMETFRVVDGRALSDGLEVPLDGIGSALRKCGAEIVHLYGPPRHASFLRRFPLPYVTSLRPDRARLPWNRPSAPAAVITPIPSAVTGAPPKGSLPRAVAEAVEDSWFTSRSPQAVEREPRSIASYGPLRPGVRNMIEQTLNRVHRMRGDVEWLLYDDVPSLEEMQSADAWVDPCAEEDLDGLVAEALVSGVPAIAARTSINQERTQFGRLGTLVPPGDPNELTHAILTTLFKPETVDSRVQAAWQARSRFRPDERARALIRIYESMTR